MKSFEIGKKSQRITDYLSVMLLVLFSGLGNLFFRDVINYIYPILFLFMVFIYRKRKVSKNVLKVFFIYFLYIAAYFVKYKGDFDPMFSYRVFSYIFFSYLVVSIVKYRFFMLYENIMYYSALISLPLFILQWTTGIVLPVLSNIQSALNIKNISPLITNAVFFTWHEIQGLAYQRNSGFLWEPGPYAVFLIMALIINLARNKFNFKNKKFYILFAALISTFSTTGFMAFFIVLIWYVYNQHLKKRLWLLVPSIILIIITFSLPFMGKKIQDLSEDPIHKLNTTANLSYQTGNVYSIGRFAGFYMNMLDFVDNPIIGYGGHAERTWRMKNRLRVASINGLGRWMARFGIVGIFIFFYAYAKSVKNFSKLYSFRYPLILIGVIVVTAFGFGLIQTPLFFAFMLSYLYLPADKLIDITKS